MVLPMFENHFMQLNNEACNELFFNMDLNVKQTIIKAVFELNRAIAKYPDWPADIIHQAAIVNEESGELTRAALQRHYEKGNVMEPYNEAKQTAAMGLRFMLNYQKTLENE